VPAPVKPVPGVPAPVKPVPGVPAPVKPAPGKPAPAVGLSAGVQAESPITFPPFPITFPAIADPGRATFGLPLAAGLPVLRAGTRVAARTSARRADLACRRRQEANPRMAPSRTRKTTTAMTASVIRLWPRFLWITVLCSAGADGGACAPPLAPVAAAGTA